jgi:lysyl-tRNA synthetase, class II
MNTTLLLSEQEVLRREKLNQLTELGWDAYPAPLFPITHMSEDAKKAYENDKETKLEVCLAGRIMSINDKGKVWFIKIQDGKGLMQLYVKRDDICPTDDKRLFDDVVKRLDLGDFIGINGFMFTTKTGEVSVHTSDLILLSKSLKPLPVVKRDEAGNVFDAVTDPEFRYRQRYADLVVNPDVRNVFIKRSQIISVIRNFYNEMGMLEVETPILQPIPGGATARPFITHHNTLDMPLYLRIANELYLKRLIVGGFDAVYEFAKDFRNEGMDRTHNPEFTVMEMYAAYKDYIWMMDTTERLLEKIATSLHGTTELKVGEKNISFKAPFKRITMFEAIKEHTGFDITGMNEDQLRDVCKQLNIHVTSAMGKGKLIDEIFGEKCEGHYIQPTFITDYPVEMSPLTKKHRSKEGLVERFELMINGKEVANAYSELNDPIEQRARFEEQVKLMERGDDEAMYIDYDFLRALEYGMPPTSGIGIGIDRLTMLMTNQSSIQDVLFFPQMRAERMANDSVEK